MIGCCRKGSKVVHLFTLITFSILYSTGAALLIFFIESWLGFTFLLTIAASTFSLIVFYSVSNDNPNQTNELLRGLMASAIVTGTSILMLTVMEAWNSWHEPLIFMLGQLYYAYFLQYHGNQMHKRNVNKTEFILASLQLHLDFVTFGYCTLV